MKKFSLIALLLLSFASFAQSKFIEVEVTDTISLKPLSFQVNLYIEDDVVVVMDDDVEYDPLADEEAQKNKLQAVKGMLEGKKYKVAPLDDSKSNIFNKRLYGAGARGWTVVLNGEAEVQKLKDLLAKEEVRTEVSVLKYADEGKAEEQLIKKTMDKAKARAMVIGTHSGLKPGRILEVKEGKQGGGMDVGDYMEQVMKLSGMGQDTGSYIGSLSKTFVVKFAAE